MNSKKITLRITALMLVLAMAIGTAACNSKKPKSTTQTTPSSEPEITTTTTTTETTTALTEYKGPLPDNDVNKTWDESNLETETIMYCTVSAGEFLNVRKGPASEHERVGRLSRGQAIKVVAKTSNGWYKTFDGFYISGEYLSVNNPT